MGGRGRDGNSETPGLIGSARQGLGPCKMLALAPAKQQPVMRHLQREQPDQFRLHIRRPAAGGFLMKLHVGNALLKRIEGHLRSRSTEQCFA